MGTEKTVVPVEEPKVVDPDVGAKPDTTDEPLGEGGLKALKAERERATVAEKQTAELAAKLQEIEDRDKSDADKRADQLAALQAEIAKRDEADERKTLIAEIAEAKGISEAALSIVSGSTREELEKNADILLSSQPVKPRAATEGPGGAGGDDIKQEEASADDIAANVRI